MSDSVPAEVAKRVRAAARDRCSYCLSPQRLVMARLVGKTPTGRATVSLLHLADDPDAIVVRSYWVEAGWHPPTD